MGASANSTVLACPVMVCAFNMHAELHLLEIVGVVLWVLCWIWESVADGQKHLFLLECKKKKEKYAVLGFAPYDGKLYFLWTLCRHPNYFGEWMAWNAFVLMGIPSLLDCDEENGVKLGLAVVLFFTSRTFYDCLNYWTGSEPAEYFSLQKRPRYRDYQQKTRMFFPFEMPLVNH